MRYDVNDYISMHDEEVCVRGLKDDYMLEIRRTEPKDGDEQVFYEAYLYNANDLFNFYVGVADVCFPVNDGKTYEDHINEIYYQVDENIDLAIEMHKTMTLDLAGNEEKFKKLLPSWNRE